MKDINEHPGIDYEVSVHKIGGEICWY